MCETDIVEDIRGANNVLVLGSSFDETTDKACRELFAVSDPSSERVLMVTLSQTVDDVLEFWDRSFSARPAALTIVSGGASVRSSQADTQVQVEPGVTVLPVAEPRDLTTFGIRISQQFTEWATDETQLVGCVNSITELLQYTDLQRLFRFLHVLTGRVQTMDAVVHYHLDPSAHDSQTVATITQLFDAVIERDETGDGIMIKTR